MIKVTVIIPVYNVENYLQECINSVVKQTYKNIEIILVNDGSTDGSLKICEDYLSYTNVKLVNKKNGGLSSARNAGIENATGDYVVFLDSDDFFENDNYISGLVRSLRIDTDLIIFGMKKYYEKNNIVVNERLHPFSYLDGCSKKEIVCQLMEMNSFKSSACTKMVKLSMLKENSIYFEENTRSEDIEWSLRVLVTSENIIVNNGIFYIYRQNRDGSITKSFSEKDFLDYINVIKRCLEFVSILSLEEKKAYYNYINYQYLILMGYAFNHRKHDKIGCLKDFSFLLQYYYDRKSKLIYFASKIIGVKGIIVILGFYLFRKGKRGE